MFQKSFFVACVLFSSQLFAYQVGESLPPETQKQLNLDDHNVAIIDFFAEWCVSCRAELPEVNELSKQLQGRGVQVIGIDIDEELTRGIAFQKSLGLVFPVINDTQQRLVGEFQPIGMPALYYIYQGKILKIRYGAINDIRDVILNDLQTLGLSK